MWHNRWQNGPGNWGWLLMAAMMIVFWGGVAWLTVSLVRHGSFAGRAEGPSSPPPTAVMDPEAILHERFARGEIDVEEYDHRVDAVRAKRTA